MAVYVCGDTHGNYDLQKLKPSVWVEAYARKDQPREENILIVAGDFGFHWTPPGGGDETELKAFYESRPWTTLWIDGNHENFETIQHLPRVDIHTLGIDLVPLGDTKETVGKSAEGVYHLQRGGIYSIQGRRIFVMGGAASIDKNSRKEYLSWWKEEIPNREEASFALNNLKNYLIEGEALDYVITHTVPGIVREGEELLSLFQGPWEKRSIRESIKENGSEERPLNELLNICWSFIDQFQQGSDLKGWYFGHWHVDGTFKARGATQRPDRLQFTAMYNKKPRTLE